ncbi:MAG: amidohydrolase [Ardenticatenaceae bacterium]|nr:amidohydrolase [Ardenticatenaceae bacterium]
MSADLVLTNGRIHTLHPAQPTATAVAIRDGKFLAVGNDDAMRALLKAGGEWLDLGGRTVTPGLVDAHVHFQWLSMGLQQVDLDGTTSVDDARQRIRQHMAAHPPASKDTWVYGRGWFQEIWPDKAYPTAAQLDDIVPDNPAFFPARSGHAGWANSRAMQLAGITAETADPPGGEIQRDANGSPTGITFETGMDLIKRLIPQPTVDELADAMRYAQTVCWAQGLTGIHDFDGALCFQALQTLNLSGELGLRFIKNVPVYRIEAAVGVGLRSGFGNDFLRIGGMKIFADGALGLRTASMIAPYEGESDNYGIIVTDKEEMMERASFASANGFSVTIHAIGDKANHDVLDVYEAVRQEEAARGVAPSARRHRIEHVQILHQTDLHRLAQLKVIASMQPIHVISDMETADRNWGDRTQYSYAWRTMLDSGAVLAFGTDAPVEKIDTMPGIHAAVSRRHPHGYGGPDGWHPEQKLTMDETIHAFTMGPAITCGQEAKLGSITPGKLADLTIYERDIYAIPHDELLETKIAGTVVGGEFKYRTW